MIAAWSLGALVVFVASALLHLATPLGRTAAADMAEGVVSSRIRGTMQVGAMPRLDFDGVEMRDVVVTSPAGERVIWVSRMTAEFAFLESLSRGAVVMTPCVLEGGHMRISRGPRDQIALVHALEVPADRFMIPVQVRDIRLRHQRVVFDLPGVPFEIEMAEVFGLVDMGLGHQFRARMDQVTGHVNFPVVNVGFERLSGRIQSDDARPLIVQMVLDLEVAHPSMEIAYSAPGVVGRAGSPGLGIELGVDVPDRSGIATRGEVARAD